MGPAQKRALQTARRAEGLGMSGVLPGRRTRRSTLRSLEAAGLMRSEMMVVCDGDGYALQPERERRGWTLTAAGRAAADAESLRRTGGR